MVQVWGIDGAAHLAGTSEFAVPSVQHADRLGEG